VGVGLPRSRHRTTFCFVTNAFGTMERAAAHATFVLMSRVRIMKSLIRYYPSRSVADCAVLEGWRGTSQIGGTL
jgi:hypothetical protein